MKWNEKKWSLTLGVLVKLCWALCTIACSWRLLRRQTESLWKLPRCKVDVLLSPEGVGDGVLGREGSTKKVTVPIFNLKNEWILIIDQTHKTDVLQTFSFI